MANKQNYVPAGSKKARQIAQAKGAREYNPMTMAQSLQIEEWNARVAAKNKVKKDSHAKSSSPN